MWVGGAQVHSLMGLSVEAASSLNIIIRCLEGNHAPITKCFLALLICNYCITASHCPFLLCVCVCARNRCIPHLSIITRVNISDDVMVSDRWLICSWAGKRRNQSGFTHVHTHRHIWSLLFYQLIFEVDVIRNVCSDRCYLSNKTLVLQVWRAAYSWLCWGLTTKRLVTE